MARFTLHLSEEEKKNAEDRIKTHAPKGSTIYCVLRHVSRSGMMRRISFYAITKEGTPVMLDRAIASLLDLSLDQKNDGVPVGGCGMDMGFHCVYEACQRVYGDGYAVKHAWL